MIANFFNKTKPIVVFNLAVLLFVFYFVSGFFANKMELSLSFLLKWLTYFFGLILYLLIFKFIVEKNKLTRDNAFGMLLVVLFFGTFSEVFFSNSILISNIILLLSFRKIYSLGSGLNTKLKLFDAAFWIGVSVLISPLSLFYIALVFVGVIIYKKVTLKNFGIPIIGLATPIFLNFTYHFYYDSLTDFYDKFSFSINLYFESYFELKFIIPMVFLIITLLWSIVAITPKIISVSNNRKFSWIVLIYHLIISLIIILGSPVKNGSELLYLVFPSAIIITNFLQSSKSKLFKNVILYIFLAISVSVYFL